MKIEYQADGILTIEMQCINANPRLNIKKIFFKWNVVLELEILL